MTSSASILVVDDEEVIRQSFRDYLEDAGYKVLTAENGRVALDMIQSDCPDLVLSDLRMPLMSGLELIRHCADAYPDMPIVVISGANVIEDAVAALRIGAYDYLIKPVFEADALSHTVERALMHAQLVRENRTYQQHLEALVLERTRELDSANAHLRNVNVRLRKIVATTQEFSACLDVASTTHRVLDEFAAHMQASGGSLYLVEDGGMRLTCSLDPALAEEFIPFPLPDSSIFGRVMAAAEPLLIRDLDATPDVVPSGWQGYRNGSLLVFPLPGNDGIPMGVIALHSKESRPFFEEDREIGTILASYSSEAIRSVTATETLRESEQRFRELADMLPLAVCETDLNGQINYANRHAHELFGYESLDGAGTSIASLVVQEDREEMLSNAQIIIQTRRANADGNEYLAKRSDDSSFPIMIYSSPIIRGDEVVGLRAAGIDISELRSQQEQILRHAHFDSLTQLPNRCLVLDRLAQLIKEARRRGTVVAVLFLDLDDFKKVNDTLGHGIGDRLLIDAAKRLQMPLRDGDTVGRLGGDEFVVLLGGQHGPEDARTVAANILRKFRQVFQLEGRELLLTASLGVALYPVDGETPEELLRNADAAMYHAKKEGRNTFSFFTRDMNEAVERRLLLEEHLHGALERGELHVHFQPFVSVAHRSIVGAEALLRWKSPELGPVGPDEFIPVLEQTGQIVTVGRHVLQVALRHAASWRGTSDFWVAVNFSPRQFRDPSLVTFIREQLDVNGLPGSALELEITEGVLISASLAVEDLLRELSEIGVRLSMDDFGTGYSSLSYLRNYPFNTLKIDRSFVRDIHSSADDQELLRAAVLMGRNLGLKVVAEGVETLDQLNVLASMDCDLGQGYLFSRPVPADEFSQMLNSDMAGQTDWFQGAGG